MRKSRAKLKRNEAKRCLYDMLPEPLAGVTEYVGSIASGESTAVAEYCRQQRSVALYDEVIGPSTDAMGEVALLCRIPGRLELSAWRAIDPHAVYIYQTITNGLDSQQIVDLKRYFRTYQPGLSDIYEQTRNGLGTARTFYRLLMSDVYRQLEASEEIEADERPVLAYQLLDSRPFTAANLMLAGCMGIDNFLELQESNIQPGSEVKIGTGTAELTAEASPLRLEHDDTGVWLRTDRRVIESRWTSAQTDNRSTIRIGCPARVAVELAGEHGHTSAVERYIKIINNLLRTTRAFESYEAHMDDLLRLKPAAHAETQRGGSRQSL